MLSRYFTVRQEVGQHEIIIQKSRFIAHIKRVESEQEAQEFIQTLKKKYWDASHNCSAYMIGENDQVQKANDDGEPSGTAGVPILEVLKKKKLKDTVVVITRYFGGIKLGAGGLIRAYGKATSEGLDIVGIVERRLVQVIHVTIDYTWLGKIEKEIRDSDYIIKEIHYLDTVEVEVYVNEDQVSAFHGWITELTNGQAALKKGKTDYLEVSL
ncbi:putative YigZ family protein [Neobacillus niacini]|uniref:YigZ family protein n=1 Tax=Neobacillus niacini TaxID=86668 RepID=UPI0028679606|nr:YigZ family protein [Neobacillus niacini]MDR7078822.1 putative YigZ family protein [Neobacillus niacini]